MFDHVTPEQRQNVERYYNDLEYRAEVEAKFASQQNFDDQRHLADMGDGSTEQPRLRIGYYEKRPHSLGTFLMAAILVGAMVFLLFPWIIMFLFSF